MEIDIRFPNPKKMTEGFVLSQSRDNHIWITKFDGEGMEISEQLFYDWLHKFYEENF